MKKIAILPTLIMLSVSYAGAQVSAGYLRLGTLGQVMQNKSKAATTIGAIYMDTVWRKANITLINSDQVIPNIPVKYELKSNEIELLVDGETKVLDPKQIKSMVLMDRFEQPHEFVNGSKFSLNGTPFRGLLEVISTGRISLYKQYSYYIQPSNKNEALSTGTIDETPKNENFLFYTTDTALTKLPKRKKLLELFGPKMEAMQKYIKDNHLDTSEERHLKTIFDYYNSLPN